MLRSEINAAIADASLAFERHHWHLPPNPRWDVTGFGLGDFRNKGLVLLNLAELPQYCEKLMFCRVGQLTILHTHRRKQEDIICRIGTLAIQLFAQTPDGKCRKDGGTVKILHNGQPAQFPCGTTLYLKAGERVTLTPGVWHQFWAVGDYVIIGEVSTANDDLGDNVFDDPNVGRFEQIEEDVPPLYRLVSDNP